MLDHPEIIFNPSLEECDEYFGLAKVSILPPYELFHPVLPVRIGEKLTFPLCGECVKAEQAREKEGKMSNNGPKREKEGKMSNNGPKREK